MQTTGYDIAPAAQAAADDLAARARAAYEQREAAYAAENEHTEAERLDAAENELHRVVRRIVGPDAFFSTARGIEFDADDHHTTWTAEVHVGSLRLMVRADWERTTARLAWDCIDCDETILSHPLSDLADVGSALHLMGQPCRTCATAGEPVEPAAKPRFTVTPCDNPGQLACHLNIVAAGGGTVRRIVPFGESLLVVADYAPLGTFDFEHGSW